MKEPTHIPPHPSQPERISILGATGSIGDSTLEVIARHPNRYQVYALSGLSRLDKLFNLCVKFRPQRVCVDTGDERAFAERLTAVGIDCEVLSGQAGLCELARDQRSDKVVAAIVGAAGLPSTLEAVRAGQTVLLANKESLVMAGDLMTATARQTGACILPIDSEHNAIFQCLPKVVKDRKHSIHDYHVGVRKLWLTASGGGFLHKSYEQMRSASVAEAIAHPNWTMGRKISIDSATMMNKGLELIEACHLFDVGSEQVAVAIHPQSIIHSMVEYSDGSFIAQLGAPDMKTPIAHALAYPERIDTGVSMDVFGLSGLEFIVPDEQKFSCLALARTAMDTGNGACIALNAANEVAVEAFLAERIALTDIAQVVARVLEHSCAETLATSFDDLEVILEMDRQARRLAVDLLKTVGA